MMRPHPLRAKMDAARWWREHLRSRRLLDAIKLRSDLPAARVQVAEIKREVALYFDIKISELESDRRSLNVARPRQVAMFLARSLTPHSLPVIGRYFGNRDHSTVLNAVRRIEALRQMDVELDFAVLTIRETLTGVAE